MMHEIKIYILFSSGGERLTFFPLGPSPMTRFPNYAALSHLCFSEVKCIKIKLSVAWEKYPRHHPFSHPHKTLKRSSGRVRVRDKE